MLAKKRKDTKRSLKSNRNAAKARHGIRRAISQQETRLTFPAGEPDVEGLRSVMCEWLVPRLVEKFLRQAGVELRANRPAAAPSTRAKTDFANTYVLD